MAHFIHHRTNILAWLAAEIGRIAAEWSELEWQLEETIRVLLAVEIKHGRIVTTGMNIKSRITTAINLVQAHALRKQIGIELCEELLKIEGSIKNVQIHRNNVVHGLWGLVEGQWYLLRQRQQRVLEDFGKRQHGKKPIALRRAVLPDRELMTRDKTKAIRSKIKACSAAIDACRAKILAALPPSPHISPRQLKQTLPLHKTRRVRTLPPQSS